MLLSSQGPDEIVTAGLIDLSEERSGHREGREYIMTASPAATNTDNVKADLGKAQVEIREEAVQRVYVDGKPVGPAVPISR
jgi:hypothetical protein